MEDRFQERRKTKQDLLRHNLKRKDEEMKRDETLAKGISGYYVVHPPAKEARMQTSYAHLAGNLLEEF